MLEKPRKIERAIEWEKTRIRERAKIREQPNDNERTQHPGGVGE